MDYILKNKDKNVLCFSAKVDKDLETTLHDIQFFDEKLLPLSMRNKKLNDGLVRWIEKRKIPKGRQFAKNILAALGEDAKTLLGYIKVSFGLSLNDSFWVVPADGKEYTWKEYNLYHNEFDKALQLAAFGERITQRLSSSPEYTTNGMLPKCWHREDGNIYLYKGSYKKEASAEYYNYQIVQTLGFTAIPYGILKFHERLVSSCPLFTNENIGYVPAGVFLPDDIRENSVKYHKICADIYGQEVFEDMMVFDALIGNIDRHSGNFGMLVDNNTLEILGPAPLFDNGMGLLGSYSDEVSIKEEWQASASAFGLYFDEQLSSYLRPRHMERLEKLVDFRFVRNELCNIPESVLCEFEALLHEKVKEALKSDPKRL